MWSNHAFKSAEPIYERVINHPFITELASGSLDKERFLFYIEQDIIYLSQLSKSMFKLASRLTDAKNRTLFEKFAIESMQMEQSMQNEYAADFTFDNYSLRTRSCIDYSTYESTNAETEDVAVALASMLPCYWIYKCVGDCIASNAKLNNPYASWIALYSDETFAIEVEQFIAICNDYALNSSTEIKDKMIDAFTKSTQFEYDFWDDAYNMRYA